MHVFMSTCVCCPVLQQEAEGGAEEEYLSEGDEAVVVGSADAPLPVVPTSITQSVWVVAEHKKPRRLMRLLATLQVRMWYIYI